MGGYYPRQPNYGDRIADLLMQRGDIEADRAAASGQIWGRALAGIGQQAQQFGQQWGAYEKGQQEQQKKAAEAQKLAQRDEAWLSYVQSNEWRKDPTTAYTVSKKIWGPDWKTQLDGLASLDKLTGADPKQLNPTEARKSALTLGKASLKLTDEALAQTWEPLRSVIEPIFPGFMPEQFSPEYRKPLEGVIQQMIADEAKPEKAPGTHVVAGNLVDDTGKVLFTAPKEPKAPAAPKEPRLEKIETVVDGKTVTTWVEPKAGATYAKPSGQAKPATGQQRKALQYFNRGKEAEEIAAAMEQGGKVSATKVKYIPEFANFLRSSPEQAYVQAQRAFTEARLRAESGAAVPKHEYENDAITYFKQPGDSEETVAQKRQMRREILAGRAFEAGDALSEFYGDEAEGLVQSFRAPAVATGGAGRVPNAAGAIAPGAIRNATKIRGNDDPTYINLPKGAVYIAPDGQPRIKR